MHITCSAMKTWKLCQWVTLSPSLCILLLFCASGMGQTVPAASDIPPSMESEQAAVETLKAVLDHAGGRKAWAGVHSVKLKADVSMSGVTGTHRALFLDDWATKDTRYRRRFEGRNEVPREHDGGKSFPLQKKGAVKHVPEFDQARVLLSHLPFASAEIMLRRSEYKIVTPKYRRCPADSLCFDIYQTVSAGGAAMRQQEWTISKASYMPTVIRYILTNSGTGLLKWKEIDFGQFSTLNGFSVPVDIDTGLPGGIKQHWHFSAVELNAAFDKKAFDNEVLP
jgi:hypothetical protein